MLQIFGTVDTPPGVEKYGWLEHGGLTSLISNLVKFIALVAGLYALVNLVLAGLQYISASGDPKKTSEAWQKIYMSGIGLLIIVSSFTIAGIISWIFFGDWNFLLLPAIYGPN